MVAYNSNWKDMTTIYDHKELCVLACNLQVLNFNEF